MNASHSILFAMQAGSLFWEQTGQWLGWLALILTPIGILSFIFFLFLRNPLRRLLQGNVFIDVIETCLKRGTSMERAILEIACLRETGMGIGFHVVAGHLESGCGFVESLERTRGFLPAQTMAVLKVGLKTGVLAQILPACRSLLRDGLSSSRASLHYLLLIAVFVNPLIWVGIQSLLFRAAPALASINQSLYSGTTRWMQSWTHWMMIAGAVHLILVLVVFAVPGLLFGGSGSLDWLRQGWFRGKDAGWLLPPWRKARILRDFTSMLTLLLDTGMAESRAVTLAAEATASAVFVDHARNIASRLAEGQSLMEAIQPLDASGELQWRLGNACHGRGGFALALKGWQERLEARSFEQEQAMAQALSTALLVVNGLALGTIAAGFFAILNSLAGLDLY